MNKMTSLSLLNSILSLSTVNASSLDSTHQWSIEQMMHTKAIADVQLSPDNQNMLFVVSEAKMTGDLNLNSSSIYQVYPHDKNSCELLIDSKDSLNQPRWSPDGKWIAFLSTQDKINHLYLISATNKNDKPVLLSKNEKTIQTFSWSPDSQWIAFVMEDKTHEEKNSEKTKFSYAYQHHKSVNRLWLLDVFSPNLTLKALTPDDYCVRGTGDPGTTACEFDFSPDNQSLTFAYSPSAGIDDFFLDSHLATIDLKTYEIKAWEKRSDFEATPRYSPDGQSIACLVNDSSEKYAINRHLALYSPAGEFVRRLSSTFNEGPFLVGPNILGWTGDQKNILFFEPKKTKFHLMLVPADGSPAKEFDTNETFFQTPSLSFDRKIISFTAQSPAIPPEVYYSNLADFKPVQLSSINHSLSSMHETFTESVSWLSEDRTLIEGLLTYPVHYEKGKKYPLLLVLHGGPMGFFNESFLGSPYPYPYAAFAESGFMIFRPNPRGSCGYGKDFRCANYQDWGGKDIADILTGVDDLISKGSVDAENLGIMGWSYGGYLTASIITRTTKFKAASLGAGPYNLISLSGTTDLHRFMPDYLGDFFDHLPLYQERSPLYHVKSITASCLIQHGIDDKRVPVSQAYELYHAMKRANLDPRLILYPDTAHGITKPKIYMEVMEDNLKWFKKHLMHADKNASAQTVHALSYAAS